MWSTRSPSLTADDDRVGRHPPLELLGRAVGDDLAVVHDHHAVAQRVRLLEVVRREEDGRAAFAQHADLVPQVRSVLRVEARGRLVEEEHVGLVDDAERDVETPALTARVRVDAAVGELGEVEHVDQ